jgi:hypothetical protein
MGRNGFFVEHKVNIKRFVLFNLLLSQHVFVLIHIVYEIHARYMLVLSSNEWYNERCSYLDPMYSYTSISTAV